MFNVQMRVGPRYDSLRWVVPVGEGAYPRPLAGRGRAACSSPRSFDITGVTTWCLFVARWTASKHINYGPEVRRR